MRKYFYYILLLMTYIILDSSYVLANTAINVGVLREMPPLAFKKDNTKPQNPELRGLSIDIASMLNANLNKETLLYSASIQNLVSLLHEGKIDYISAIPDKMLKNKDLQDARIIQTSFAFNRRIIVADSATHITCEEDYYGHKIIVLRRDEDYAQKVLNAGGIVVWAENHPEVFQMLLDGEGAAFIAQYGEIASYLAQRQGIYSLKLMGLSLERVPLVVVARNKGVADQLTGFLSLHEQKGELNLLREKWLGKDLVLPESYLKQYMREIISIIILIGLTILAFLFWNISLKRRVQKVTRTLEISQQRYVQLIEASPDLIMLLDKEGKVFLANKISRHMLFCTDEITGEETLLNSLCEKGQKTLMDIILKVKEDEIVRGELLIHTDTENPKTLEVISFQTKSIIYDEAMICCIARDISERLQMEKQLLEAEKLAVIGTLAASVAHEINNPLGIIQTNSDMALEMTDDEKLKDRLDAISRNVTRAATITQKMLHLAVPTRLYKVDLSIIYLIRESLSFLTPRLKDISIHFESVDKNLNISGDISLLQQVIINLILNSLDSMNDSGALIFETKIEYKEEKAYVFLSLEDTGEGIREDKISKIFDPFFSSKHAKKGFGLGLFVCNQIAKLHNGFLYAESEYGKSAKFTLALPIITD